MLWLHISSFKMMKLITKYIQYQCIAKKNHLMILIEKLNKDRINSNNSVPFIWHFNWPQDCDHEEKCLHIIFWQHSPVVTCSGNVRVWWQSQMSCCHRQCLAGKYWIWKYSGEKYLMNDYIFVINLFNTYNKTLYIFLTK